MRGPHWRWVGGLGWVAGLRWQVKGGAREWALLGGDSEVAGLFGGELQVQQVQWASLEAERQWENLVGGRRRQVLWAGTWWCELHRQEVVAA
jgi:hypothetical protein